MAKDITDANDCIVKVGEQQAGGTDGVLIIDSFEVSKTKNKERKYGVGNKSAKGRTSGNEEVDLSFTHIGQNTDLARTIDEGDFAVVLDGDEHAYELDDADGDYTVSVEDGGDYTFEFDGNALGFDIVTR